MWSCPPSCTFVMVKVSKLPLSSYIITVMPSWKPHSGSFAGQPGSAVTPISAELRLGPLSASPVCDSVGGTYIKVIVSLELAGHEYPAGAAPLAPPRHVNEPA